MHPGDLYTLRQLRAELPKAGLDGLARLPQFSELVQLMIDMGFLLDPVAEVAPVLDVERELAARGVDRDDQRRFIFRPPRE